MTEAVLEEQVELLLHETLHHHPEQEGQVASFVSYSRDAAEMEDRPSFQPSYDEYGILIGCSACPERFNSIPMKTFENKRHMSILHVPP